MHRRHRDVRRRLTGLGFLLTIVGLVALMVGGVSDNTESRSTTADVPANTYSGPGIAGQEDQPTLEEKLKAGARAQTRGEGLAQAEAKAKAEKAEKAEAERKAKAEKEAQRKAEKAEKEAQRKAKAEKEAQRKAKAEAEKAAEAERREAADAAARSTERAVSDPQAVAYELMADYGWGESEFSCLQDLWTNESNWDYTAENPSSGAYGIPQSLPPEKMAESGDDYRTNPITQIEWGLDYIDERYGSPCAAWDFWQAQSPHWY